jgi:2-isopropylmalate synthase
LGKHSGRHALKNRCAALRIEPTRLELDELYRRMIALADRKKVVRDDDLFDLWSAMKRAAPRAKAPVSLLFREETAPADEAGYGHGV